MMAAKKKKRGVGGYCRRPFCLKASFQCGRAFRIFWMCTALFKT